MAIFRQVTGASTIRGNRWIGTNRDLRIAGYRSRTPGAIVRSPIDGSQLTTVTV